MSLKNVLIYLSRKNPLVIIDGPRNQEKLRLSLSTFPEKSYISLSDSKYRELFLTSPSAFFLAFPDGVIIDEAQLMPSLDSVLNEVKKSSYEKGKFILLYNGIIKDKSKTDSVLTFLPEPEGQFKNPFDLILNQQKTEPETIINDAMSKINVSNRDKFAKFLRLCASMNGKTLSVGSLAANSSITPPAAARWLEILEELGIIVLIEPLLSPKAHPTVKKPKLFFYSSSLLCSLLGINSISQLILSPNLNEIVQAFTISTISRFRFNQGLDSNLYYYQERNGFKVDLIAKWKHPWAFDISCSIDAAKQNLENSQKYVNMANNQHIEAAVLYLGELTFSYNKRDWISYLDWEKMASGLNYYS